MNKLEAAIEYARNGFRVFPCVPNQKFPMVAGGFKAATTDESQLRAWWQSCPEANVAIRVATAYHYRITSAHA